MVSFGLDQLDHADRLLPAPKEDDRMAFLADQVVLGEACAIRLPRLERWKAPAHRDGSHVGR